MKHLLLFPALAILATPTFATMSSWADPWGKSMTPLSTWNTTASQGVFGGLAHRMAEGGETPSPSQETPTRSAEPTMALSITASGLLDFVFQQMYSGFSGEEAARIRAVLAPQYEALALHLQAAFGGADMVAYPEGTTPTAPAPDSGSSTPQPGKDPVPAATSKTVVPTPAPASGDPLTETQTMAVVAATSLLLNPEPTMGGTSANLMMLDFGGFNGTPLDASAVPEPSTLGLIGAGLACLLLRRRNSGKITS